MDQFADPGAERLNGTTQPAAGDAMATRYRSADERDAEADARDARADQRDLAWEAEDAARGRPLSTRVPYRSDARHDRQDSAEDRRAAACDRAAASDALARAAEQIDFLMHDRLTGFYQAGAGMIELEREVLRCQRTGELFTIVFVDVDGLKAVNDSSGHLAGDQCILVVADAIKTVLREYDVVVRYGGDEFVCGMQGLSEAHAVERFESMQARLVEGGRGTASVGVAQLQPSESLRDVISRADHAMYVAKALWH